MPAAIAAFRVAQSVLDEAEQERARAVVSTPADTVGFVGLGAMGAVQAGRLLDAGHSLAVFDTRPEAVAALAERGAQACASVAQVGARAETVLVSLPRPDVVLAVACGDGGLVEGGAMRTFVDLSTTGLATARELLAQLGGRGVDYLDAPVSGGVAGAEAGRLAVYCAGQRRRSASAAGRCWRPSPARSSGSAASPARARSRSCSTTCSRRRRWR